MCRSWVRLMCRSCVGLMCRSCVGLMCRSFLRCVRLMCRSFFRFFFLSTLFNLRCILRDNTCKRRNTPFLFSSFVSAVINVCTLSKDNSSFCNHVLITFTVPPKVARTSKLLGPSPGYPRVASKPVLMRSSTTTTRCV